MACPCRPDTSISLIYACPCSCVGFFQPPYCTNTNLSLYEFVDSSGGNCIAQMYFKRFGNMVYFDVVSANNWFGIGFTDMAGSMIGSDAVITGEGINGVSARFITDKNPDGVSTIAHQLYQLLDCC